MLELIFNQSLLEDFFFSTMPIFYVMGMVVCFVGLPIFVWFWKRKIPKPARTLMWSGWKGEPPLLLCHDSGRGELTTIRERKGEGIVMTAQDKYKILPRYRLKVPMSDLVQKLHNLLNQPKPQEEEAKSETTEEETQQPQPSQISDDVKQELKSVFTVEMLKDNFLLDYSDLVVKRTTLVGLNLPFFVAYTGKLCLLNPEALALYEAGDMKIQSEDGFLFNPHNLEGKTLDAALQPMLLMDPRKIQQIINSGFDQSQIAGVVADSEELAREGMGMSPKLKLIIGIVVIACLAAAALFLLPQIMGGTQQKVTEHTPQFILTLIKHLLRI